MRHLWLGPVDAMPDSESAPLRDLDRELARLQRRYGMASHLVGERGERPAGIDDDTLAWWVAAHRAVWRRRMELTAQPTPSGPVEAMELRKDRLRKPSR